MAQLTDNVTLRAQACAALKGKWGTAAIIMLVYLIITGIFYGPYQAGNIQRSLALARGLTPPGISLQAAGWWFIGMLLVILPVAYGMMTLFLQSLRSGMAPKLEGLFAGFKSYGRVLGTMLLMTLYTALWSMLLMIPGIIKSYSYAMTPYLLLDEPELGPEELIKRSMKMMEGNKMKLFLLDLSFLGWILLAMITCGIGMLWVTPYMQMARAGFYEDLKRAEAEPQA